MLALAKQLAAEMGVDVSTLIGANSRPREPDYPRKSNPPGIQGIAWPDSDPCPQRSASSHSPANQIARIAQPGVFTQPGSRVRISPDKDGDPYRRSAPKPDLNSTGCSMASWKSRAVSGSCRHAIRKARRSQW
jgi:hypothetical protein